MAEPVVWTLAFLAVALMALGLAWWARARRARRRDILFEDALKRLWVAREEDRTMTPSALGGALGLSPARALDLVQSLAAEGHVVLRAHAIELTATGAEIGLRVLRGHRLWERYLADELQRPLGALHGEAERREHSLSPDDIVALADHLGHPRVDPHGDRIPTAAGEMPPGRGTALTDWRVGEPARVVHIEDEPLEAPAAALRAGLHPGGVLQVTEHGPSGVTVETATGRHTVDAAVAAQIDVRSARGEGATSGNVALSDLPVGAAAEVTGLDDRCTGLMRRRLLDLGFTPGADVAVVLSNFGAEARAYQIRGTQIALRKEQAGLILIGPRESWKRVPAAAGEEQA